ncbi:hypothetical protein [Zunongwangia sp. HRR-M8]|uniref:hypothetical protein n=1 Tax=Zunongwangia sp. HRR-M8 TaxID=3015170 RepID=UPI0022DE4BD5|nr:hypothetical protein [Zunongwangia sp. HRR-M8]WBL23802.1 hypothetical protein PBT89_07530 [Zunongwangia sp. HRR-M8]
MNNSKQSFDYLLKDFKPNINYKDILVENYHGGHTLTRYPVEIPEKLKIQFPFMVYLIFVEILKYPILPLFEKVKWEIPILYKGFPFVLAHRKFGFDMTTQTPKKNYKKLAIEAIEKISKAIPHAEPQLSNLIQCRVSEGKITIESQYQEIRNRYIFFKEKFFEINETDQKKLHNSIENFNPKKHQDKDTFLENYKRIQRLKSAKIYYIFSMVDAYFSLLEHVSVLLLPFISHINIKKIDIESFMRKTWKDKLKIVINHPSDQ